MFKIRRLFFVFIAAALCVAFSAYSPLLHSAERIATAATPVAQTTERVKAANAFLATLSDEQRQSVIFPFTDSEQRVRWSNFPEGAFSRAGLRWGQLDAVQRTALMNLLGTALSSEGVEMVRKQMAADDVVAATQASGGGHVPPGANAGGGNGRPPVNFGSDYYYVAFLGTPSTTAPWMLQYGGHHLAINATVVGSKVTLSPTLTGGEPLRFTTNGTPVRIAEDEIDQSIALLNSLTDVQRNQAIVSDQRVALVLGPGKDGQTLPPEGLSGNEMTDRQKQAFLKLIEARLDMLNANDLAVKMSEVEQNLNETYFGWWGPTAPATGYFRITGPTVVIEYSPEVIDGDPTNHAHNMYRDPTNEYGAAWISLQGQGT
jgi:hypothetical protein